ncbi:cell division ATP-binding protein FtsE [Enterococcus saccharolyticus]|uniref:cell division ATP-binding protein FtsE n=1 Tax=Enterococcus saccharolyticus TaxID=41997 RepID=UPI0039DF7235
MIKVKNASKRYGNGTHWALKNVSFHMNAGEFVYLVGPSGSGKSTLLKLLSRQEKVTAGSIQIDNILVDKISDPKLYLLRRKMGIVTQEDIFLPQHSAYQNVAFAIEVVEKNPQTEIVTQRALAALEQVGMLAYKDTLITDLSIGQRKRIAIARALVNNPLVLLADEPTANLDVKSAVEMMKIFLRIHDAGTSVIIATHDSTMVNSIRKRVLELSNGNLIRDEKFGGYTRVFDPKDVYVW